eukprot:SM000052S17745  [mRNA]  locus=s52:384860:389836:- [translate_table: standard]
MVERIPVFLEVLRSEQGDLQKKEALDYLLALGVSSREGLQALLSANTLAVAAGVISTDNASAAPWFTPLLHLLVLVLSEGYSEGVGSDNVESLATTVTVLGSEFGARQDELKFGTLTCLLVLLKSADSSAIKSKLRSTDDKNWLRSVRTGIGQILHSRVAPEHRQAALRLANEVVDISDEGWLLGPMTKPKERTTYLPERFFLLIVETLTVEIPILLQELVHGMQTSGQTVHQDKLLQLQLKVSDYFLLLEHIIEATATAAAASDPPQEQMEEKQGVVSQIALRKAVASLGDIIAVVLEFLEKAKASLCGQQEKKWSKDDSVLAAVRLVGHFLAEVPEAHQKRVLRLFGFMLTVKATDEDTPLLAVRFLLPALLHITSDGEGCKALVKKHGHKRVVALATTLARVAPGGGLVGGAGDEEPLMAASNIVLNLLGTREDFPEPVEASDYIPLLPAMVAWRDATAAGQCTPVEVGLPACVVASVLELTEEEAILRSPYMAEPGKLASVAHLIVHFIMAISETGSMDKDRDLWDITVTSCTECMHLFPTLREAIVTSSWVETLTKRRPLTAEVINECTSEPIVRMLLAVAAGI